MTSARDCHHRHSKVFSTDNMKLTSSASEQNVYFTYVCLVDDLQPAELDECDQYRKPYNLLETRSNEKNPPEEPAIQVERTKALYELVETLKDNKQDQKGSHETDSSTPYPTTTSGEDSESENEKANNFLSCDNPNILKLTKMKWLTEDHDTGTDSRKKNALTGARLKELKTNFSYKKMTNNSSPSPSLSSATSNTSSCSKNSDCDVNKCDSIDDKYLSTILRLDKEHNMFGLSSIAIIGSRPSKLKRTKDDERAVFHQTAIVQICCGKRCCKNRSKTDLPCSLKCGACKSCCIKSSCTLCTGLCTPTVCDLPVCPGVVSCATCPRGVCSCRRPCPPAVCRPESSTCYGFKIKLNRHPKYEPEPIELTPRSSSILQKPVASRSCHHTPRCIPPSPCFPYVMPCYWPSRPSAPCSNPKWCFHNPPCPAPRRRQKVPFPPQYTCPKHGKTCAGKDKKCTNEVCPGNDDSPTSEVDKKRKEKRKKIKHTCECWRPPCVSCFVTKPEKQATDDCEMPRILKLKATSNGADYEVVMEPSRPIKKPD